MASLSTYKNKSGELLRVIQYTERDGSRPKIGLGVCTKAHAEKVKGWIEKLIVAKRCNVSIDTETATWVAGIDDDNLHGRLVELGLTEPRIQPEPEPQKFVGLLLGEFLDSYLETRTKMKPSTVVNIQRCRAVLVDYFGERRLLVDPETGKCTITPGDCDDFREKLSETMAENTVRRLCGRSKQFFRYAVRKEIIPASPFADMKDTSVRPNKSREHFIDREVTGAVLNACPNNEWKLIVALCRFSGLRCPSEHLELKWGDVDWTRDRLTVRSPKTAHHIGKELRVIQMGDVRPYLEAVWNERHFDDDTVIADEPVVTGYRHSGCNLRTQFERIIRRAGQNKWPRLFQNLRASRATELAREKPAHVAAYFMGHGIKVASEHYWQITDDDYDAGPLVQNRVQQQAEVSGNSGNRERAAHEKTRNVQSVRVSKSDPAPPRGLEPRT